ncbi:MAG: AAA family ATPase [Spirirestis rafaelensis WJT71-NPBG6]|nr:AAA family ATPase [Spirirestis rafaelensis WJT71-NPBG6]
MNQQRPVPRLDLAPKLKRPLSLWNPLDYLRLLCWVFYFPQALRWYVDTFGGGYISGREMNWRKRWQLLSQKPIQRQLLFQGVVLTVVTPLLLSVILQRLGVYIDWFGVGLGVALGVAWGVVSGVGLGVGSGVAFGVGLGVVFGVGSGVALGVGSIVALGVAFGVAFGVGSGVAFGVELGVVSGVALAVGSGVALGVVSGVAFGVTWGVVFGVGSGLAWGVMSCVAILRLENWLSGLRFFLQTSQNRKWQIPHVTPLPLYFLSYRLKSWLHQDWEIGLYNANELLAYTLQFIPVVQAVNHVLATTPPEQVIFRVVQLAEAPFDWRLVRFASASLKEALKSKFIEGIYLLPSSWKERLQARFVTNTRLDTPARAAAAGFWYLHEKEPAIAMKAFAQVRSLLYGEEMFILAETLTAFDEAKELDTIAGVQIPPFPEEPLLRPTTWETLTSLKHVIENAQLVQRSSSRFQRSSALNRALGELKTILKNRESLPNAEQYLIVNITLTWLEALLDIAGEVGEIVITEPVNNPYVAGNPVQGNLFVGRETIIRQLKELWVTNHQLQSVVIYGHRRMGKSSILRNVANFVSANVQVAYVNLLEVGDAPEGVGEVVMAICDAISDAVQIPPPSNDDLLSLPLPTFRRYLKQVETRLMSQRVAEVTNVVASGVASLENPKGLIIALDEFEQIEKLIEAGKIPVDFMGYLRGLAHKSSKIAFALAGLHTLEEMTSDYFQPFYASVITIRVGFMEAGATKEILANPAIEDFPLDYTPEALDKIYDLTHGQPYLVQLVGFQLVRRYNDQVFTMRNRRNPVFTVEDVEVVIKDPDFFKKGSGYFNGVWGQAAHGATGQHDILRILAPQAQGLTLDALSQSTDMDEATLQKALKTLTRHDVVKEIDGCWRIIVELFRLWVLQL